MAGEFLAEEASNIHVNMALTICHFRERAGTAVWLFPRGSLTFGSRHCAPGNGQNQCSLRHVRFAIPGGSAAAGAKTELLPGVDPIACTS